MEKIGLGGTVDGVQRAGNEGTYGSLWTASRISFEMEFAELLPKNLHSLAKGKDAGKVDHEEKDGDRGSSHSQKLNAAARSEVNRDHPCYATSQLSHFAASKLSHGEALP